MAFSNVCKEAIKANVQLHASQNNKVEQPWHDAFREQTLPQHFQGANPAAKCQDNTLL
jgi:hypothetical protein